MVSCKLCLQYVYIDSTWCVIQYNKRYYECKDRGLCIELRQFTPKPTAPPIDLELDIQQQQQQGKLELQPPCYHKTSKSIIKRINDFFFPRYNEYSKVKSI
jgi:hypothetical protein